LTELVMFGPMYSRTVPALKVVLAMSAASRTVSPVFSRVATSVLSKSAAGSVGSNSNLTTSPPSVFMSAWTLPEISLSTLAVENCSPIASDALPSA
jgi:hypothetical protein